MSVATVETNIVELFPIVAGNKYNEKIGYFTGVAKAATNDKIKILNIDKIEQVLSLKLDATGAWETHTVSTNEITCTSATGSATVSGLIRYRK